MTKSQITNPKIAVARASFVRSNPRKMRWLAGSIDNLKPLTAIQALKQMPQKGALALARVLEQAMGNAKNNLALSPDKLMVQSIQVLEGPRVAKKSDTHARGARFGRGMRVKRLSHIKVILEEKNGTKS